MILSRITDLIDRELLQPLSHGSAFERAQELAEMTRREVDAHSFPIGGDFSLFYAARSGLGMPPNTAFHIHVVHCQAASRTVQLYRIDMPLASSVLLTHGTGKVAVDDWTDRWKRSDQGGTSRPVFSGFCDALREGSDRRSGGEPQLVGLYRQGHARLFGVVTSRGASIQGRLETATPPSLARIEWRDELFQRVCPDGSLVKSAQVHARSELPPSFPR